MPAAGQDPLAYSCAPVRGSQLYCWQPVLMKRPVMSLLVPVLQLTLEARDNLKFLTTLERHFKNIMYGPLPGILDTLPPMMNALRMVWIISRHYSDDVTMGALFQRVAQEIGDRVEATIDLQVGMFAGPAGLAAACMACLPPGYFQPGLTSRQRSVSCLCGTLYACGRLLPTHVSWLAWPTFTGLLGLCS